MAIDALTEYCIQLFKMSYSESFTFQSNPFPEILQVNQVKEHI